MLRTMQMVVIFLLLAGLGFLFEIPYLPWLWVVYGVILIIFEIIVANRKGKTITGFYHKWREKNPKKDLIYKIAGLFLPTLILIWHFS